MASEQSLIRIEYEHNRIAHEDAPDQLYMPHGVACPLGIEWANSTGVLLKVLA